jgi:hypothetical protein
MSFSASDPGKVLTAINHPREFANHGGFLDFPGPISGYAAKKAMAEVEDERKDPIFPKDNRHIVGPMPDGIPAVDDEQNKINKASRFRASTLLGRGWAGTGAAAGYAGYGGAI